MYGMVPQVWDSSTGEYIGEVCEGYTAIHKPPPIEHNLCAVLK